jgi:hypothetical protein
MLSFENPTGLGKPLQAERERCGAASMSHQPK